MSSDNPLQPQMRQLLDFLLFQTKVLKNQRRRLPELGAEVFGLSRNFNYEIQKLRTFLEQAAPGDLEKELAVLIKIQGEALQYGLDADASSLFAEIDELAETVRSRLGIRSRQEN